MKHAPPAPPIPPDQWDAQRLRDLAWCENHNARVRFQSNKTVSVFVNGQTRRRASLYHAVYALRATLTRSATDRDTP